jgi:hypothetical protein
LGESFGVDFQDPGVPAAHDLHLLGVYPGGFREGFLYLGCFQVCGRHIHFRAALKVDTEVEAAEDNAEQANHDDAEGDPIRGAALLNEVEIAITGKDLGGCAW